MRKGSKTMQVGGLQFESQKELKEYTRSLLQKVGAGGTVSREDRNFFDCLIKRHPEWLQKVGVGVKEYLVRQNARNRKGLELWLKRYDGSEVDISWLTCITAKAQSKKASLLSAMRQAIEGQIRDFRSRASNLSSHCPKCGARIKNGHVDHIVPFKDLASQFLEDNPEWPSDFDDSPDGNMAIFKEVDVDFKDRWLQFHLENAELRLLCAQCNLQRSKSD